MFVESIMDIIMYKFLRNLMNCERSSSPLLVHSDITTYLPLRALFALPNDKAPWPLCLIGWREAERLSNINDERSAASYYSTL